MVLYVSSWIFFFGCAMQFARSYFTDQGLNQGHGSESAESQPLDHQGIPWMFFLHELRFVIF